MGMVPRGGGLFSQLNPKHWQLVCLGCWPFLREGWQRDASTFLEQLFLDSALLPRVSLDERALLRSQGGPLAALPFTAVLSGSIPTSFVCSFCGARLPTLAAVLSTALTITVQVVRWQVCWGEGVTHWSLQQLACVAKREQEFRRMCSCGIWIWLASASRINDALR